MCSVTTQKCEHQERELSFSEASGPLGSIRSGVLYLEVVLVPTSGGLSCTRLSPSSNTNRKTRVLELLPDQALHGFPTTHSQTTLSELQHVQLNGSLQNQHSGGHGSLTM